MDYTAGLRRFKGAIVEIQRGTAYMMQQQYEQAYRHYATALKLSPNDYAGLLLMANCCMNAGKLAAAQHFAHKAQEVYPGEPQALHRPSRL